MSIGYERITSVTPGCVCPCQKHYRGEWPTSQYAMGYYRARVVASAGREGHAALELAQEQYRAGLGLLLPTNLGVTPYPWLIIGIALCLIGLIQFSLWRSARETEGSCGLLSTQEMGRELEKRQQAFSRSLMIWALASTTGPLVNHSLFVSHPVTPAQQNIYGLALILLLIGLSHILNYRQSAKVIRASNGLLYV